MPITTQSSWPGFANRGTGFTTAPISGMRGYNEFQDIKSNYDWVNRIEEREKELPIASTLANKVSWARGQGLRHVWSTLQNVSVGDIVQTITPNAGFGTYAPYVSSPNVGTIAGDRFGMTQTSTNSGNLIIGTPYSSFWQPTETTVELFIDQFKGGAMLYTDQVLRHVMDPKYHMRYAGKMRYAQNYVLEQYQLAIVHYVGPITGTAGDYGSGFASVTNSQAREAIGVTNLTNYGFTQTFASIGTSPNRSTGSTTGAIDGSGLDLFGEIHPAYTNPSNYSNTPYNVPKVINAGGGQSDLTYQQILQAQSYLNKQEAPQDGRALFVGVDGAQAIRQMPQFRGCMMENDRAKMMRTGDVIGMIEGFDVIESHVIQPIGAKNIVPIIACNKGAVSYMQSLEPEIKVTKIEQSSAILVHTQQEYGAVVKRPNELVIIGSGSRS